MSHQFIHACWSGRQGCHGGYRAGVRERVVDGDGYVIVRLRETPDRRVVVTHSCVGTPFGTLDEFGEDVVEFVGEASSVGLCAPDAGLHGGNLRPEERALVEPSSPRLLLHRLEHVRREGALTRALHVPGAPASAPAPPTAAAATAARSSSGSSSAPARAPAAAGVAAPAAGHAVGGDRGEGEHR